MRTSRRRLLALIASLPVLVVVSGLLYMGGMAVLEGEPRSFWDSLEFAAESLTTTGYGADVRWEHPAMVVFVVVLQFLGVFLIFLIFPIFLIPFLEERFETRLPQEVGEELSGHLVVWGYGPAVETLIEQTEGAGLATLVVEEDEATARRLVERRLRVIHTHLEDGALEAARLAQARALIANGSDDQNAAVILATRQEGFEGDVLALVEEPLHRRPLMLAGATAVFTPRHVLGAALAARAGADFALSIAQVSGQILARRLLAEEAVSVDEQLKVLKLGADGLAGRHPAELRIRERTGVSVVAVERDDEMILELGPELRFRPEDAVFVCGPAEAVQRFGEEFGP